MNIYGSRPKTMLTIKCEWCDKEFQRSETDYNAKVKKNKKQFCSGKCVAQWKKKNGLCNRPKYPKSVNLICISCGKPFSRNDDYDKRKRRRNGIKPCCSPHCAAKYAHQCRKIKGRSTLEEWMEAELKRLYPALDIHYNNREVVGLEIDIYIPSLNLAFELNGIHHYKPIYGINNFTKSAFRDILKEHKCKTKHIDLYIVDCRHFSRLKANEDKKYLEEITRRIDEKLAMVYTQ